MKYVEHCMDVLQTCENTWVSCLVIEYRSLTTTGIRWSIAGKYRDLLTELGGLQHLPETHDLSAIDRDESRLESDVQIMEASGDADATCLPACHSTDFAAQDTSRTRSLHVDSQQPRNAFEIMHIAPPFPAMSPTFMAHFDDQSAQSRFLDVDPFEEFLQWRADTNSRSASSSGLDRSE